MSNRDSSSLTRQIATAAIALALGILLLGLSYVVPLTDAFIVVFIPFLSALLALKSDWRGQLLYFAGATAVSFIDMQEGLFVFLPNVIIGLVYGDMVKKFSLTFVSYLVALTVSLALEYALTYPIDLIYKVDLIEVYAKIFGLSKETFAPLFPLFIFILSVIQTLFCYLILQGELKKTARFIAPEQIDQFWILFSAFLIFASLFAVGFFFAFWLACLSEGYLLVIGAFLVCSGFRVDKKRFWYLYGGAAVICLVSFALLLSFLPKEKYILAMLPSAIFCDMLGLFMLKYNKINKPEETKVLSEDKKNLLK
jgi:hypothetical protein